MANKNYLRDRTIWVLCREAGYQMARLIRKLEDLNDE